MNFLSFISVDNHVLLNLDISWCSIRLTGAKALAKAIGDNNKLISIDLSSNSFSNDTVELLTTSLTRNMTLCELNLHGNQFFSRYEIQLKENPSTLTTGKDCQIYKMLVAASTNHTLKILRVNNIKQNNKCILIFILFFVRSSDKIILMHVV